MFTHRKRYDRAEKEFIESKLDLHKKLECKDQLTEHLYTVIHQNEQRKAKKLSQLMERLEMEETDAEEDGEGGGGGDLSALTPLPLCLISPVESRKSCLQSLPGFSSPPVAGNPAEKEACLLAGNEELPLPPAPSVSSIMIQPESVLVLPLQSVADAAPQISSPSNVPATAGLSTADTVRS